MPLIEVPFMVEPFIGVSFVEEDFVRAGCDTVDVSPKSCAYITYPTASILASIESRTLMDRFLLQLKLGDNIF